MTFKTVIIERYRRRKSSMEEAWIEMYAAGAFVRRVKDTPRHYGAARCPPPAISERNKKAASILWIGGAARCRVENTCMSNVAGISLRRNWGQMIGNNKMIICQKQSI